MSDRHDNVDHTFEAVVRLRALVREHERSGSGETPFIRGIREALLELDAHAERDESSAA